MSQFREAEIPFPWMPLVISALACVVTILILRWLHAYGWHLYKKLGSSSSSHKKHKKKSKKTKRSKKKYSESEDEDSSGDSSSSSSE